MAQTTVGRPRYAENLATKAFGHKGMGAWFEQVTYGLQATDKYITSAEVLALNTTAIAIVPAPGAGKYLMFEGAVIFLDNTGTAYVDDAGEDLVVKYTDKNGASVSHTADGSAFDGTTDTVVFIRPLNAAASTLEEVANAPLVLFCETGNWITGTSPLKVRTFYRVIDKADLELISA